MNAEPEAAPGTPVHHPNEDLIGPRIGAGIIDFILLVIVGVVMAILFGDSSSSDNEGFNFELNLSGGPFIVYLIICFGYSIVLEGLSGQTLGKKLLGLKVVSADGSPLTWGKAIIRNLLRVVDGFPYFLPYLLGVILVASTKSHQRIGDMVAGTIVRRA